MKHDQTKLGVLFLLAILFIMTLSSGRKAYAESGSETASPTQTPYIVYVVVTATPQPVEATQTPQIVYVTATPSPDSVVLSNESSFIPSETNTSGQCTIRQSDGSSCTMSLEVVSEPAFASGAKVVENEVFYKEWEVRNTGTCTWTTDWNWVFKEGWQLGNTSFPVRKETAPGETVNVRLGMTNTLSPSMEYYNTYTLESPSGDQCGEISFTFSVVGSSYYLPTSIPTPVRRLPNPGNNPVWEDRPQDFIPPEPPVQ